MRERFDTSKFPRSKTAQERLSELSFSKVCTGVLQFAIRLGARKVLAFHGKSVEELSTQSKIDTTPVTAADLESEKSIIRLIRRTYSDDKINAEETGSHEGESGWVWYVDPLDGTSSFSREQRYSTVGIAVYERGVPVAASICNPFERELLIAETGKGAYLFALDEKLLITGEPKKIAVSKQTTLRSGVVYLDALFNSNTTRKKLKFIEQLRQLAGGKIGIRMTGSNIDQQRQVATGRAELTLTDGVGGFFDIAAGALIIEEAGGICIDIEGKPVTSTTVAAIGGNPEIIRQVLPLFQKCYEGYQGYNKPSSVQKKPRR